VSVGGFVGGFTAALQKFGIGRLAAVLGVAAGVSAVLVALMLRVGSTPDALLYSNLDLTEASEISAALDKAGIKYSAKGDGSTLFVSRDQVGTARLMLATEGLVTSGSVGYEIFDNQSVLGQTEFQQNLNEQRALQGELARTIQSMRGISSARVHITMPRREMFSAAAADPTAAVVVGLSSRDLSAEQVRAIRNVVASSVPNLKPDKVTVTDQANRTLAAGSEDSGFTSATAESAKASTEAQMQSRIRDIVEGVVGQGAARVQVTADIDHSRSTTQEQRFDPDGQVVRSTTTSGNQSQDTSVTGAATTATANIPGGEDAGNPVGQSSAENSEVINYEISNTTTTTIKEPGEVKRLSVSVAVDGRYTPPANGEGAPTYEARTPEEVEQIKALVAAAVGLNEERGDKIEVVNVRFNRDALSAGGGGEAGGLLSNFSFDKNDIMRGVELLVLLITGMLLIFFVLRPLLKTANGTTKATGGASLPVTQLDTEAVGNPALLAPPTDMEQRIDIARIEGQVKASSIKKVADFVQQHPEESTSILRSWVHETR
jgi:flagellar M-ring protein FliF